MRPIDADGLEIDMAEEVFDGDGGYKIFGYSKRQIDAAPTIAPQPNDPLTLEELRGMDGEPVWITPGGFWALVIAKADERVRLRCNDGETVWADKEIELVGPVYRRRPEEGDGDDRV